MAYIQELYLWSSDALHDGDEGVDISIASALQEYTHLNEPSENFGSLHSVPGRHHAQCYCLGEVQLPGHRGTRETGSLLLIEVHIGLCYTISSKTKDYI